MKIAGWLVALFLVALGAVFAIHNRAVVKLDLWPFPIEMELPSFGLVLLSLLIGFLVGAASSWFAGSKWRRLARARGKQVDGLVREVEDLKQRLNQANETLVPIEAQGARPGSVPATTER